MTPDDRPRPSKRPREASPVDSTFSGPSSTVTETPGSSFSQSQPNTSASSFVDTKQDSDAEVTFVDFHPGPSTFKRRSSRLIIPDDEEADEDINLGHSSTSSERFRVTRDSITAQNEEVQDALETGENASQRVSRPRPDGSVRRSSRFMGRHVSYTEPDEEDAAEENDEVRDVDAPIDDDPHAFASMMPPRNRTAQNIYYTILPESLITRTFPHRDLCIVHLRMWAESTGSFLTIRYSSLQLQFATLTCVLGRKSRAVKNSSSRPRRDMLCPFQIKVRYDASDRSWGIIPICQYHDHPVSSRGRTNGTDTNDLTAAQSHDTEESGPSQISETVEEGSSTAEILAHTPQQTSEVERSQTLLPQSPVAPSDDDLQAQSTVFASSPDELNAAGSDNVVHGTEVHPPIRML